jgi:hypothetical protein
VVAKAYRLLHAIFTTAVDDRLVRRNPCRVEGGGREESPERETLSLPEVFAIADAARDRDQAIAMALGDLARQSRMAQAARSEEPRVKA